MATAPNLNVGERFSLADDPAKVMWEVTRIEPGRIHCKPVIGKDRWQIAKWFRDMNGVRA